MQFPAAFLFGEGLYCHALRLVVEVLSWRQACGLRGRMGWRGCDWHP